MKPFLLGILFHSTSNLSIVFSNFYTVLMKTETLNNRPPNTVLANSGKGCYHIINTKLILLLEFT